MLTAYVQPGKAKSRIICKAFAHGCGGAAVEDCQLRPGPMFLYGVAEGTESIWRKAADGRDRYLGDNAYFDGAREQYFRVTKNRLQHCGIGESDGSRLRTLRLEIAPWRRAGEHVLVCPQSPQFMRAAAGYRGDWTADVLRALRALTDRPVRVRPWLRDKGKQAATLAADLIGAYAVITWSSAAAVQAVIAGVPVVCAGQSAAAPMAGALDQIERLPMPDNREQWAAVLADQQYTLGEMRSGLAWGMLNAN